MATLATRNIRRESVPGKYGDGPILYSRNTSHDPDQPPEQVHNRQISNHLEVLGGPASGLR